MEQSDETRTWIVTRWKQRNVHVRGGYRLLAALLDVGVHEVFGVGLEDLVDLVEEIVEFGLDLLRVVGCGGRLGNLVFAPRGCRLADLLSFGHRVPPSGHHLAEPGRATGTGYDSVPRQTLSATQSIEE